MSELASASSAARRPPRRGLGAPWIPAALLSGVYCALLVATLGDYGVTRDEVLYLEDGTAYARWLAAPSLASIDAHWTFAHPPLHKTVGGLTRLVFHERLGWLDELEAYRLSTVGFAFLLSFALYLFADSLFGGWVALAVVASAAALPRLFFHAHLGALDYSPAALVLVACAIYWRAGERLAGCAAGGAVLGLAIGTKLTAALAAAPIAFLFLWRRFAARETPGEVLRAVLRQLPLVVLPPLFLVALWPWLWPDPWARATQLVGGQVAHFMIPTYYLGEVYLEAPFHYPFVMAALTTPTLVLAAALLGLPGGFAAPRREALAFVTVAALTPLVAVALPGVRKAGGVRLFLIAFPFVCLLAGAGLAWIGERLRRPWAQPALACAYLVALLATTLPAMIRLHPYQLAYFNALAGGLRGASESGFDLDYWGASYDAAVDWMNRHPEASYWVPVGPRLMEYYQRTGRLRPGVRLGEAADADYVVALSRPSTWPREVWEAARRGPPAWSAGRSGVDLVRIYALPGSESNRAGAAVPPGANRAR